MPVERHLLGTPKVVLSTGLNNLANNAQALSSTSFDNTRGATDGNGSTRCIVEFYSPGYASSPAALSSVTVWFILQPDGTNYEDGSSTVTPAKSVVVSLGLQPSTNPQRTSKIVGLPPGRLKVLTKNSAGVAMPASGNTITVTPFTSEGASA